jgi:hypothetical protein
MIRELAEHANRRSAGDKRFRSRAIYWGRFLGGAFFGWNPNYPFPVLPGKERRGLLGQWAFDIVALGRATVHHGGKFLLWLALILGVAFFVAPTETARRLAPVFGPVTKGIASRLERVAIEAAVSSSVEVRKGLYLAVPPGLEQGLRDRLLEVVREDDRKVTRFFGQELEGPIVVRVEVETPKGAEPHTVVLGSYDTLSRSRLGAHSIRVSLVGALAHGTVGHELTHAHVGNINPTVSVLLNEGLAHFVEKEWGEDVSVVSDEMVARCPYPSGRHWLSSSRRGESDTIDSRALGYVVVHFLHRGKGYPLAEIPALPDRDLPSVEEILDHLRGLKLELAKRRSLRRNHGDLDLEFWEEAYLASTRPGGMVLPNASGSPVEAEKFFQNLLDLSVAHLRWSGMTDEEISAMAPEAIMEVSEEALAKLPDRLDELGLRLGEEMFDVFPRGIYDDGLQRLIDGSYLQTAEGNLARAIDQGWARVFVGRTRSPNEPLPPYSPALLQEIVESVGPPSPARRVFGRWELRSRFQDEASP